MTLDFLLPGKEEVGIHETKEKEKNGPKIMWEIDHCHHYSKKETLWNISAISWPASLFHQTHISFSNIKR